MSVMQESFQSLSTRLKLQWNETVKYDKGVTKSFWKNPSETMKKEWRYLLLQAELGVLGVAVACTALGRDQQTPNIPAGGTEGQGGQPDEISPDLYVSTDLAKWDKFYDRFFEGNVNVPFVSEEMKIKGDQTYSSLRTARVQSADLDVDFFMAQKTDGSVVSFPVRWFQDAKTGEMNGYQMQIGQDSAGRTIVSDYLYDSQGNYVIAAKGDWVDNSINVQEIWLPGEEDYIDISKLGSLILSFDQGLGVAEAAESTATPVPTIQVTRTPDGRFQATLEPSPTATTILIKDPTEKPTSVATLEPSETAKKIAETAGATAKRFNIIRFDGKFPGSHGDYWFYTATDGVQEWTIAISTNYYDPKTGRGQVCTKGNCQHLEGKVIDAVILVKDGINYYDPTGENHNNKPYVYVAGIIID